MKKLKNTLLANAVFSAASGLTLLVGSGSIAKLLGTTSQLPLQVIGLGLIGFACYLCWVALRSGMPKPIICSIILQDWLWVAGSALIILTKAFDLSNMGYWIIGIVALIVGDFALLQMRFLSRASLKV
jgi:hypothetical protein